VAVVRKAAYKVSHEIHRLQGLLRFCPDENGTYTAHCEPDHFVLPALGPHFRARFGNRPGCQTPWAIIDEKRNLCLRSIAGQLDFSEHHAGPKKEGGGEWESLWRNYHKNINNESRNNPNLQKKLMPKRYWKYLTEM
jgi:probable DNA metabolism protein